MTIVAFMDTKQASAVKRHESRNKVKEAPTLEERTLEDPTLAVKDRIKVEKVVAKATSTQEVKATTHLLHTTNLLPLIHLKVERARARIKALVKATTKVKVSPKEAKAKVSTV